MFGLPVKRPQTSETAILGAAIDAAVGLGPYADFDEAVGSMPRIRETIEPTSENVEIYRGLYEKVYLKVYKSLQPLNRAIKEIAGYPA